MGKMALAALGMTLVACLVYSAATEPRQYAAYSPSVGLAQRKVMQGDVMKMEMQLAAKEVHHKVFEEATKNLPAGVKAVASKLTQNAPLTKLVDCTKKDAYKLLQDTFADLATNITAQNASIYATNAKLEAADTKARALYMAATASFRTAESAHTSAHSAAVYAKGKFDEFTSAVNSGQAEYDEALPALTAEKDELVDQQPILEQVKTLVSNMAASAKGNNVQLLKQLPELKKLANAVVPPRKDKAIANKVLALRTSLAETGTASTVTSMLVILDEIITSMATRITEIDTTLGKMETDLDTNKASLNKWETDLVELSDEADKASNTKNTADLHRQQLNGEHIVASEAYQDFHAGFVDEAAKLAMQLKAIATIGAKIDSAVAECGGV
jgi:chromosome segregation ATPase